MHGSHRHCEALRGDIGGESSSIKGRVGDPDQHS